MGKMTGGGENDERLAFIKNVFSPLYPFFLFCILKVALKVTFSNTAALCFIAYSLRVYNTNKTNCIVYIVNKA